MERGLRDMQADLSEISQQSALRRESVELSYGNESVQPNRLEREADCHVMFVCDKA